MRKPPPPCRKGAPGKRGPKARRFCVPCDLGDGKRALYWFIVDRAFVTVRRVHGRKRWTLPLWQAVEVIARRAQIREGEMRQHGTAPPPGPLRNSGI